MGAIRHDKHASIDVESSTLRSDNIMNKPWTYWRCIIHKNIFDRWDLLVLYFNDSRLEGF